MKLSFLLNGVMGIALLLGAMPLYSVGLKGRGFAESLEHRIVSTVSKPSSGQYRQSVQYCGELSTIVIKGKGLFDILMGVKPGNKQDAANRIEKDLGAYCPPIVMALGLHYIAERNYTKGALYCRLAMFRAIVDVRASNDDSLQDLVPLMYGWMGYTKEAVTTQEEANALRMAFLEATKVLIAIDKKISRAYDLRWASLHSVKDMNCVMPLHYATPDEYKKIIEAEYVAFQKASPPEARGK